jgi:hypothetical protein
MNDQTNQTIEHAGIAAAWVFWVDWFKRHPDKVPGFDIRTANKQDILLHGECPFCYGTEIIKFRETVRIANYKLDVVLCVCCLLRIATVDAREEESPWQKETVSSLKELNIPKGAAEFTKIIKAETNRYIYKLGQWIYLSGTFGTGKSHLLNAVKTHLRSIATYVNTADLSDKIYDATGRHTLSDLVESLIGIPVLLLDDLGSEYNTDYLYSVLYKVINGRYARGFDRPTFITSNLPLEEIAKSPNDNLRRIASRLSDTELVVQLVSKQVDYRGLPK